MYTISIRNVCISDFKRIVKPYFRYFTHYRIDVLQLDPLSFNVVFAVIQFF